MQIQGLLNIWKDLLFGNTKSDNIEISMQQEECILRGIRNAFILISKNITIPFTIGKEYDSDSLSRVLVALQSRVNLINSEIDIAIKKVTEDFQIFINEYFYMHVSLTKVIDTMFNRVSNQTKLYKLYVYIMDSIGMIYILGNWPIHTIITRARDYSSLEEFHRNVVRQFDAYELIKNNLLEIYGYTQQQLISTISSRSFHTLRSISEDIKKLIEKKPKVVPMNDSLVIGNKQWLQLSGPRSIRILTPTNLFDGPPKPSYMLLGDIHGGNGDCNTVFSCSDGHDPCIENVEHNSFFKSIDSISSSSFPVDFHIEWNFIAEWSDFMLDLEVNDGTEVLIPYIQKKRSQRHDSINFLLYNYLSCYMKTQKDNYELFFSNTHCPYTNIRWHFADPRSIKIAKYPFDNLIEIIQQLILYKESSSTCKRLRDMIATFDSFHEFTMFFNKVRNLYLLMFCAPNQGDKLIITDITQTHVPSAKQRLKNFITFQFHNGNFNEVSILNKYKKRNFTFCNNNISYGVSELYKTLSSSYYTIYKNKNFIYQDFDYMVHAIALNNFFSNLLQQMKYIHTMQTESNACNLSFPNVVFQDLSSLKSVLISFVAPSMDCYFLLRTMKACQGTQRPNDKTDETPIPWLQVLYAGDTHSQVISGFLSSHGYRVEQEFLLQDGKQRCVTFEGGFDCNKLKLQHEVSNLLRKYLQ